MPKINITIREAIDAIRKNGYEQVEGDLVRYKYDYETNQRIIIGGCAMGQGAINLGLTEHPHVFEALLQNTIIEGSVARKAFPQCGHIAQYNPLVFTSLVEHLNDEDHLTIEEIAKGLDNCFTEEMLDSRVIRDYVVNF